MENEMSTISQAPKINTARNLNNRNLNLLVVAALVVTFVVIVTSIAGSPAAKPMDHGAYTLYRQGEWVSVPIRLSNAEAYQIFRRGEVASPLSNAEAYHLFRLGEWASANIPAMIVDMAAYHLSERTMTEAASVNPFAEYFASERTLVDPLAGLATYFESERTSIPVNFTTYQLSEWFGQ
jgi:hypothetical protein